MRLRVDEDRSGRVSLERVLRAVPRVDVNLVNVLRKAFVRPWGYRAALRGLPLEILEAEFLVVGGSPGRAEDAGGIPLLVIGTFQDQRDLWT